MPTAELRGRHHPRLGPFCRVLDPGSMLHQIGSVLLEPAAGGRIRCRSYASFRALHPAGVLRGYGSYDDIWTLDDGECCLACRETVLYGQSPSCG